MKIAVVGATGLVGREMLKVLEERNVAGVNDGNCEIIVAASSRSVGKEVMCGGKKWQLVNVDDAVSQRPDYAIFSAGGAASLEYAPKFAEVGTVVVDNSSAWRMTDGVPLVVAEVNMDAVKDSDRIIANPNCSTIQMVLALSGLQKRWGIKRLVVSTYQSVTGSGLKGIRQLESEERGEDPETRAYPWQIHRNILPHGGDFQSDGYTTEEEKLVRETRKIFNDPTIGVSATVARVPVVGGHSESVNVELKEEFDIEEVIQIIKSTEGCLLVDNPAENRYPMPILTHGRDEVMVGRVRRDPSQPRTLNMWVVADNLRKGAATNAVEIVEKLLKRQ